MRPLRALAFLPLLALAACASDPRQPPAPAAGAAPIAATDVYPPDAHGLTKRYDVFTGPDASTPAGVEHRETSQVSTAGTWTVTNTPFGADGSPKPATTSTLIRSADGGVAVTQVLAPRDEQGDGDIRLYVYEPPLVLMPPALSPEQVFEQSVAMTERDRDNPARVRGRGEATRWIRPASQAELTAAFGPAAGDRGFVSEMRVRFGPAQDIRKTIAALGPAGITLEQESRTLDVFMVRMKDETSLHRLEGINTTAPAPSKTDGSLH